MPRNHLFASLDPLFAPGRSPVMQHVMQAVERIALSDLGILIVGEEGTGKDWLAGLIHRVSGRGTLPLVTVDGTLLPAATADETLFGTGGTGGTEGDSPGLIDEAAGGTMLFRRFSAFPGQLQKKIIRAFEHGQFRRAGGERDLPLNVRAVATVAKRLADALGGEGMGKEVYHKFCPVMINLPPLRERRDDIPFLIESFILDAPASHPVLGITGDALDVCLRYDWPGNTRELKAAVRSAAASTTDEFLHRRNFPEQLRTQPRKEAAELLVH